MLSPIPRRSGWAHCFAHFTQPYQPSPIWQSGRPAHRPFRGLLGVHSRYGLHTRAVTVYRDTLSEGFSHFVTSMTAPVASGWSGCRVGLAPTGKRRLFTAHATSRTYALQQNRAYSITSSARSGAAGGMVEPKRLGGLEVDDQLELGRRLNRQVGRLLALEDPIDVCCRSAPVTRYDRSRRKSGRPRLRKFDSG